MLGSSNSPYKEILDRYKMKELLSESLVVRRILTGESKIRVEVRQKFYLEEMKKGKGIKFRENNFQVIFSKSLGEIPYFFTEDLTLKRSK